MHLKIVTHTATSAAGTGLDALRRAIGESTSGLRPNDFDYCELDTWIGRVTEVDEINLPSPYSEFESRNNRLAWLGLNQDEFLRQVTVIRDQLGAQRIGVILGTSTSSIGQTEAAYRNLDAGGLFEPASGSERSTICIHPACL